ncbi:hypothetical protein BH11BAC7_BH11BAC7_19470 [soil metagenome]
MQIKQLFLFIFLCSFTAKAIPPAPADMVKRYGFSAGLSGVVSFFKADTRHSDPAKARAGMGGIFKMEFYPSTNVHIQFGLEFISQACRFNTYYFAPGYSEHYDRTFGYTHTLRTLELYVPIIARIGLSGPESTARNIFYVLGGYAPKFFLNSKTSVKETATGKDVWGGSTELEYEHQFLGAQTGNVMLAGIGFDHRRGMQEKFISIEIIYRYNLSRFIYRGRMGIENTNELFLKNSCLNIQIGYRFQ